MLCASYGRVNGVVGIIRLHTYRGKSVFYRWLGPNYRKSKRYVVARLFNSILEFVCYITLM